MSEPSLFVQLDQYIEGLFQAPDPILEQTLDNMETNGLPSINVSANEGKLLYLLAKLSGARKVLEVGTLGGYSTIWLARALPADGQIITLEYSPKHAEVARENIARAGFAHQVEVRVGAGLDLLPQIAANNEGPFDLFFIDADKVSYPGYLEWAIKLSRPGSVILSDNLLRNGGVLHPSGETDTAIARYNKELAQNPRLESIVVPIIRDSADGLGITIVKSEKS